MAIQRNFFHRPKVFFMLMVICLSPFVATLQACSSEDCDDEKSALAAAKNALLAAKKNHKNALDEYDAAKVAYDVAFSNYEIQKKAYERTLELYNQLSPPDKLANRRWLQMALNDYNRSINAVNKAFAILKIKLLALQGTVFQLAIAFADWLSA